jgi:RHS repeat-associated protein
MLTDGLGSVRGVVDTNANVLWSANLDGYGNPFSTVGTAQTNYGFTGEYGLPGGLVHLRARNYQPGLGVFASLDPFEGMMDRAMSINGYGWVEGNVVNAVDPTGNAPTCQTASDCSCYSDNKALFDLCQTQGYPLCPKPILDTCSSVQGLGVFSLSDNDVINAIAIAIFGEGRFAGPEGIQISAAAAINKLRNGNQLRSFGGDYGAALIGLTAHCEGGGYEDTSNERLGVRVGCINNVVNGIMEGVFPGGASGRDYSNASAMRDAVNAVRSQLRYVCGKSNGTFIQQVQDVLNNTTLRLALTFHSSWNEDFRTLKCCMKGSGIIDDFGDVSVLDYRTVVYLDEGIIVSNANMLSYAYDAAQNPKSASEWGICEAAGSNSGYLFPRDIRLACETNPGTYD